MEHWRCTASFLLPDFSNRSTLSTVLILSAGPGYYPGVTWRVRRKKDARSAAPVIFVPLPLPPIIWPFPAAGRGRGQSGINYWWPDTNTLYAYPKIFNLLNIHVRCKYSWNSLFVILAATSRMRVAMCAPVTFSTADLSGQSTPGATGRWEKCISDWQLILTCLSLIT